jgi:magnesium transporter
MENNTLEENKPALSAKPDYTGEIISIIRSNRAPNAMRELLEDYHENDIAEVLPSLTGVERVKIYRSLDVAMLANILEYAETEDACKYLNEMDLRKAAQVIEQMESDDALELLHSLDKTKRANLIECMDETSKKEIALMSTFEDDEIGSKMTTNYISIHKNLTVKQAMISLIDQASENDNITTIFVTDDDENYYGAIDLKELILARRDTKLDSIIMTSYPYVYGHEDIDDCIEQLKDYSEDLIPVLNNSNHLLGVITSQSIIQVVDEEMGEDYAKLAGLTTEEDLNEPLSQSMKKRLPWLLILLGLGTLVSTVVGVFEGVVSQLPLIICFQSLILDMAGNVGTQSLAVTIRVLMDETLTGKQKAGLVFKEMRVGFSNGLLLGVLSFLILGVYIYLFKGRSVTMAFAVSGCIGISLIVAMVISSMVGTLIPLFFNKINIDPAVASGPLITTVNDLVAVVTYYGLSWFLLLEVLHLA